MYPVVCVSWGDGDGKRDAGDLLDKRVKPVGERGQLVGFCGLFVFRSEWLQQVPECCLVAFGIQDLVDAPVVAAAN